MTEWESGCMSVRGGGKESRAISAVGYNVSKSIVQRQQEGRKVYDEASNRFASSVFYMLLK